MKGFLVSRCQWCQAGIRQSLIQTHIKANARSVFLPILRVLDAI
jgi:hypothetical protein